MTEQNNIQLPKSWKILSLSRIIEKIESGKRPKGGVQNISEGIPSIGGEHLDSNGNFKFEKIKYVPVEFAQSMLKGRIQENDILVVKDGATTGKVSFVGKNFPYKTSVINEHVFLLRFRSEILPKYVFYKLWSRKGNQEILKDFRGAAQGGISTNFVNLVEIPLPPLPEQHRIVAKIEELFSEIDKAVENLQTARQQIKTYRQSVLKHAFEGKLTAAWREGSKFKNESLKLAAEPEAVYQTKNGLPEGWKWKTVGDICTKVEYGSSKKSDKEGLVPVLRMGNIQNGLFDWTDLVFSSNSEEIEKYRLKKGDVLFNRTNSPELVGKTAIYLGEQEAIFAGYLIRIHYKNDINPKYLTYYLNSLKAKEFGNSVKTDGVNQSNINGQKLKSYPFPKCTLEEQHQIVAEIEKRFSEANKLEESIETALRQTEALRQSILKKAFAGKLVEPDENKAGE